MISVYYSLSPSGNKSVLHGISAYTHEILLVGGNRSASFTFNSSIAFVEDWFYSGIGRHIEVYNGRGNMIWDGVVDTISFNVGARSIVLGPLLNISNNIRVGWRYPNYGLGLEIEGEYDETSWKADTSSVLRYGALDELVSGGEGEAQQMLDLQDVLLEQKAEPSLKETLSTAQKNTQISMSISCIGYTRILEKQVYNFQPLTGPDNYDLSEKITEILNANQYFVGDKVINLYLEYFGVNFSRVEEDNRTAWGIISDHMNKSSVANKTKLGIFNGINFILSTIDSDDVYTRRAQSATIFDNSGKVIENSELVPGGIMIMTDFSRPIKYRINSIQYSLAENAVSINFHESSLRHVLAGTMLGGLR